MGFVMACLRVHVGTASLHEAETLAPRVIDWDDVLRIARSQALAPVLHEVLADCPLVPECASHALRTSYLATLANNQEARCELRRVLETLDRQGIEAVVTNGAALAEMLYDNPALWPLKNIDLLLHQDDMPQVCQLLSEMDFCCPYAEKRPGFDLRFGSDVERESPRCAGLRFDLHWRAANLPVRADVEYCQWLWDSVEMANVCEHQTRVLGREASLLRLVSHIHKQAAGASNVDLLRRHDIALFIAVHADSLDWRTVIDAAERFGLVLCLRQVIPQVVADWRLSMPERVMRWIAWMQPSSIEREIASARGAGGMGSVRLLLRKLSELEGLRNRLAFAGAVLFPSREYMLQHYPPRWPWLWAWRYVHRWLTSVRHNNRQRGRVVIHPRLAGPEQPEIVRICQSNSKNNSTWM